ncbi:MAG: hypothetical protein WCF26_16850, partial [Candidatus Sulfotelmatobacter sp.]
RQRRFAPTAVHLRSGMPFGFPPESAFTFTGIPTPAKLRGSSSMQLFIETEAKSFCKTSRHDDSAQTDNMTHTSVARASRLWSAKLGEILCHSHRLINTMLKLAS